MAFELHSCCDGKGGGVFGGLHFFADSASRQLWIVITTASSGQASISEAFCPAGPKTTQQIRFSASISKHLGHVLIHGALQGRIDQTAQLSRVWGIVNLGGDSAGI
jgi:hypothetical protein